jgi:uncharacterized protein (TIGR03118 family)
MNNKKLTAAGLKVGKRSLVAMTVAALSFGCHKSNVNDRDLKDFDVVNLVANTAEYHPRTWVDLTLINGFGIAWSPTNIAWVNSVGGHVSELYRLDGTAVRPGVLIPSRTDSVSGLPCGVVFSGGMGFKLGTGTASFIFDGFDGVLSAWNGGNVATRLNQPTNEATSYTGLAIGSSNGHNYIYGANFGEKKIDVWDTDFHKVKMAFYDPGIPSAYSPYNIQAVGDKLFVVYGELAASGPSRGHGIAGAGKGYVSVFAMDGSLVGRFASRGTLNLPWGVTMAPGSFLQDQDMEGGADDGGGYGKGAHYGERDPKDPVVLVGNFGDGRINVYTQEGKYLGQLQSHKHPIEIGGLWALSFPPAPTAETTGRLYFSAGPENEADGVFGYIIKR